MAEARPGQHKSHFKYGIIIGYHTKRMDVEKINLSLICPLTNVKQAVSSDHQDVPHRQGKTVQVMQSMEKETNTRQCDFQVA